MYTEYGMYDIPSIKYEKGFYLAWLFQVIELQYCCSNHDGPDA